LAAPGILRQSLSAAEEPSSPQNWNQIPTTLRPFAQTTVPETLTAALAPALAAVRARINASSSETLTTLRRRTTLGRWGSICSTSGVDGRG
jgi:hypothetical protein